LCHRANATAITDVVATAVAAATVAVASRPIRIFGSNQGTEASTMMYGWSACHWMCRMGADSVNTTTSMSLMSSCRKYHGCEQLWLEVAYSTVSNMNSYVKPFLIAKTPPTPTFLRLTMVKKCHNTSGRMKIDPLNISPLEPPLGRSN
jgi:hypothetical protein